MTITNGSRTTLRAVKVRTESVAGFEDAWRSVPDIPEGHSVTVDLRDAVESAQRPGTPPEVYFSVQLSQERQPPQLQTWNFKAHRGPSGEIQLEAFTIPSEQIRPQ